MLETESAGATMRSLEHQIARAITGGDLAAVADLRRAWREVYFIARASGDE